MNDLPDAADDDLLWMLLNGDEEAFAELYRKRQAGVYRFALRMSGSPSLAEDITQEVFLTVMRDARGYIPQRGPVSAWLVGIARNLVLRHLERRRETVPIGNDEQERPSGAGSLATPGDLLGDLTRKESIDKVRQAVLALPPHYREVVILCDLEEMGYEAAAAALDCAVGTVRSRLHRGRCLLLEKLRERPRGVPWLNPARCRT